MGYGPEARPVEPPFNHRIALPWYDFAAGEWFYPWGLGTTSYKLFVICRRHRPCAGLLGADDPHESRP